MKHFDMKRVEPYQTSWIFRLTYFDVFQPTILILFLISSLYYFDIGAKNSFLCSSINLVFFIFMNHFVWSIYESAPLKSLSTVSLVQWDIFFFIL